MECVSYIVQRIRRKPVLCVVSKISSTHNIGAMCTFCAIRGMLLLLHLRGTVRENEALITSLPICLPAGPFAPLFCAVDSVQKKRAAITAAARRLLHWRPAVNLRSFPLLSVCLLVKGFAASIVQNF